MMINYPERYYDLMDKCNEYRIPVWNDDHTEIIKHQLDPDAPEEIKKAYAEAKRIAKKTEDKIPFKNWQERFG